MISEYSKYIPLERPSNATTEYFVNGMNERGKVMENNLADIQSFTDQLAGVDIVKASEKDYYDTRVNEAINNLNQLGTVDLNSSSSVRKAKKTLSDVLQDDRIKAAVQDTAKVRRIMSQWDTVRTNPKLQKNFDQDYFANDMDYINGYINSTDPKDRLRIENATLYQGQEERLQDLVNKMKPAKKEFHAGTTTVVREAKDKNALYAQYDSVEGMDTHARVKYNALLKQDPSFTEKAIQQLPEQKIKLEKELTKLRTQAEVASKENAFAGWFNEEIQNVENRIARIDNMKNLSGYELGLELYKEYRRTNHVASNYVENNTEKLNPVAAFAVAQNFKEKEFLFKQDNEGFDRKLSMANLGFREEELRLRSRALDIEERESISNSSTRSIDPTTGQVTGGAVMIPGPGEVEPASFKDHILEEQKEIQQAGQASLKRVLTYLNPDLNAPNTNDSIQKVLDEKGIKIDLKDLATSTKYLNSPENVTKLNAAFEYILENNGQNLPNDLKNKISEELVGLSKLSLENEFRNLQIKDAEDLAKRMNLTPGTKKYNEQVESALQLAGQSREQSQVYALADIGDPKVRARVNQKLQSLLLSTTVFSDGNRDYYASGTYKYNGKEVKQKDKINIDFSKSEIYALDPKTNNLHVNVQLGEGDSKEFKQYIIKLDERNARDIGEMLEVGSYDRYRNSSLRFEDRLKEASSTVRKAIANQPIVVGGPSLGLPKGKVISYHLNMSDNKLASFMLNIEGNKYSIYKDEIKTTDDLHSYIRRVYQNYFQAEKTVNPSLSESELQDRAYSAVINSLIEKKK